MNRSPNPDSNSSHAHRRLWLLILARGGIALGGFLLLAIIGGGWWLWNFIHKDLTPLAQKSLTTTLNRPVQLGRLKGFTLTGIRFEASSIPATATDPDKATVDAVDVGFDPLQLLFNRTLRLDVTLINPNAYIQQDQQGRWLNLNLAKPGASGFIKTDIDKIHFVNGKLTLLANQQTQNSPILKPVNVAEVNGYAQFLENNHLIKLDVEAQPSSGGNVYVQGQIRPQIQKYNVNLRGEGVLASEVTHLVKLPLVVQAGRANADLAVDWQQKQQPLLQGSVDLQSVQAQIPKAPRAFNNAQGKLYFQGLKINTDNLVANYGKVPLVASGVIDRINGFNLTARVKAVNIPTALSTLKVKLPLAASGVVKADLQVTGAITKPIVSGTVNSITLTKIDKVDLQRVSSKFVFNPVDTLVTLNDIQGLAKVGGEFTGGGIIRLGQTPRLNINFAAKNVNGDALAQVYGTTPSFKVGTVSATANLSGPPTNVQTVVQFQAPNSSYPAKGEVIVGANRTVLFRNITLSIGGGIVQAFGKWANQHFSLVADASGVQVERFVNANQLKNVSLNNAQFNGRLLVSGTTSPFKISTIIGENARVDVGGGTVRVSNIQLADQSFAAQLVADNVHLGRLLKQSPKALEGALAGNFLVSGPRNNLSLKTLQATGSARLAFGGGTVSALGIKLVNGVYQTQLKANDVELQQLAQLPPRLRGNLTGDFNVAGSVDSLKPQAIQATGRAQVNIASATIVANNIQLANGRYQANVQANNLQLQQLAQLPPQFQGNLTGKFNVAGTVNSLKPQAIQATGQARVNVASGTITADNIQLANGHYQAAIGATGIPLNRFNQQLRGDLSGKLQVAGNLGAVNLAALRAAGTVQLSQGISLIQEPLTATVAWNGEKLVVQRATATDLNASGYITAKANTAGIPSITGLNLNVQAKNLNLQNLPVKLPSAVVLAGKAAFDGQITGNLPVPNLQGQLALQNLQVNQLAFEPILNGNIQSIKGQGLHLNVAGKQDRIAFNLDGNNRPKSFLVQWRQAIASGQSQGDNLAVNVENFPLTALNLKAPANTIIAPGAIAGILSGNFLVNEKTYTAQGNAAIARPQIGRIIGDRLVAQFNYDRQTTLINTEFDKAQSRYAFVGNVGFLGKTPQIKGQVSISQGQIQDVLTALQLFDIQDLQRGLKQPTYGTAADISKTQSVGLPTRSLFTQIQFFDQIQALLTQQQQNQNASPIPALADLTGIFNGNINVDTSGGLAVDFNLNGQNFAWGKINEKNRYYHVSNIIADGTFKKGVLTLEPLRLQSTNRLIAFTGNVGSSEQSGQLRVTNFPIQVLSNFVKLPVGFSGNLNGTAAIAGNILNPQAIGEFDIADGTLNQKGVQSATASFNYDNGRLNFGSNLIVSTQQPVTIIGSIPYKLPFANVAPDNNQISLSIKAKDQGLAALNLLTNQVAFQNGQGEVDINANGTMQNPVINGIATVNNATFSSPALPEDLTNVTGNVLFNIDQVLVRNLQGRFSRGMVQAAGEIPISDNGITVNNPLTVNLNQLVLKIKGLYQGGASGNLQITGSIQKPIIGGNIDLSNGKVSLNNSTGTSNTPLNNNISLTAADQTSTDQTSYKQAKPQDSTSTKANTSFNNLNLQLGKNVHVIRSPLFDFQATGNLNLNGSLANLLPSGTIRLKNGSVNLFTTQLRLTPGYPQTATFSPQNGLDPYLNVQLFAKVLDVIQNSDLLRVSNTTGLSSLETVRVEATVKGPASKAEQNLQLTSDPTRSPTEIVSLLGGGFVNDGGTGNSTLGLINIAGSAVFNNFQSAFNQIGTAFGLSEFRIFPTIISQYPESGGGNSTIQIAGEAGVDVSRRFSISGIKILTANDPLQWGINYRLSRKIRLRASSNFANDSRAIIEYNSQF